MNLENLKTFQCLEISSYSEIKRRLAARVCVVIIIIQINCKRFRPSAMRAVATRRELTRVRVVIRPQLVLTGLTAHYRLLCNLILVLFAATPP